MADMRFIDIEELLKLLEKMIGRDIIIATQNNTINLSDLNPKTSFYRGKAVGKAETISTIRLFCGLDEPRVFEAPESFDENIDENLDE